MNILVLAPENLSLTGGNVYESHFYNTLKKISNHKIEFCESKKYDDGFRFLKLFFPFLEIKLLKIIKTKDILSELGKQKQQQILVGFALETNNLIEYATEKVKSKNLDLIIANSAIEKGSGFATETNKITIIDKHNKISNFELKSKQEVAIDIVNYLIDLLNKK